MKYLRRIISHAAVAIVAAVAFSASVISTASAQAGDTPQWKKLIADAKADGKLVVSHYTEKAIEDILHRFAKEFGITVEMSAARPSTAVPKILTEQKAGQYNWDIMVQPVNNVRLVLEPAGALQPVLPLLVVDEVKNSENWYGGLKGNVPMDPLYPFYDGISPPGTGFQVNRDKISKSQVNNWSDLLKPEYKGKKIGLYYPRRPANFTIAMACLRPGFKSDEEWLKLVRGILAQEPVANRRGRAVSDWLAQGRYDITIGGGNSYLDRVIQKRKLNIADPLGDNFCGVAPTGTGRSLSVLTKAPNPGAAKLFVNWYLTHDIQDAIVKAYWKRGAEVASRRKDVGHPDPAFKAKTVKGFESGWMNGKGLMSTSDEGLRLQLLVIKAAKAAGF